MLLSKTHKTLSMNIIIYSSQGNIHRTAQTDVNSSVIFRLRKVQDSSSLTSSIFRRMRRKPVVKNRTNVEIFFDELVNCGSPNQQLLTFKEVLRSLDIR